MTTKTTATAAATKTTKAIARTHLEQKYVLKVVVLKYLPTKKKTLSSLASVR
jgi:hypothetical protein